MAKVIRNVFKKKIKKVNIIFIAFIVILTILISFLVTLIFLKVDTIEVKGLKYFEEREIIEFSEVKKGDSLITLFDLNIFKSIILRSGKIEKNIINNCPLIETASVSIKLPNKIVINIDERETIGYLSYLDTNVLVDSKGVVLGTVPNNNYLELPRAEGIWFERYKAGERIIVDDDLKLDIYVKIMNIIEEKKYKMVNKILSVDLSNKSNIFIVFKNNVSSNIGDMANIEEKLSILNKLIINNKITDKGTIDFTLGKDPVFIPK